MVSTGSAHLEESRTSIVTFLLEANEPPATSGLLLCSNRFQFDKSEFDCGVLTGVLRRCLFCLSLLCACVVSASAAESSGDISSAPSTIESGIRPAADRFQPGDETKESPDLDNQETRQPFDRLSPLDQVRVITGLFTILILGLVIFIVIKAGSHMVQGMSAAANRLPADSSPHRDDWANKPLNDPIETESLAQHASSKGASGSERKLDEPEHDDDHDD